MQIYTGIGASSGVAIGRVHRVRHARSGLGRTVGAPEAELRAYQSAVHRADEELEGLETQASQEDGAIFMVQRMLLQDDGLNEEIARYIRAGAGAAAAVERAGGLFAASLRELNDDYMSERAADVLDACQRVVDILDGGTRLQPPQGQPVVLVADELYPTDLAAVPAEQLLGIVTSRGAANAHVCMLARSMGVPFVVMAGEVFLAACGEDRTLALDGDAGLVYLEPDAAVRRDIMRKWDDAKRREQALAALREVPCETRDGVHISLYATCSDLAQVREAVEAGAEGIGLLRSEYALLANGIAAEEDQYRFYRDCLAAAGGRPVTFSTFDLAAEQTADVMRIPPQKNPALGLRGVRFCLANEELFLCQLRALMRAAAVGPLRIALPMVTTASDVLLVRACMEAARGQLQVRGVPCAQNVPLGIIVEVPAAALLADELAAAADFFLIGGNDLAQYTYAADRGSSLVQQYFQPEMRAARRLIRMASDAGRLAGIPVTMGGTSAAEPPRAEAYVRMGLRALTMEARSIPGMKAFLRTVTLGEQAMPPE